MSALTEKVGKRIRKYRMQAGLSQEKLAELADCHFTFIGQIERGEKGATLDTLYRISSVLEIPLSRLLENIDMEDNGRNIPLEVYEYFLAKTPEQQEQMFQILKHVDSYGMNTYGKQ